jgi:hypothetical protein
MYRYPYLPKVARSKRGTVLGLTLAVFGFFLLALLIFHFKAVRLMGGHQEQTTAAEAAALAAANDISKIVIKDPNFGWISLSNQPATGTATVAGDGYPLPVRSLNDILATIRLDMIIADLGGGGATMKAQAVTDYNNALVAQASLLTALQNAATGSGQAYDANGIAINLVTDATAAYNSNVVRMTGKTSQLKAGSLQVTLGYSSNAVSDSPVPHNAAGTLMPAGAPNSKGWYNAFVDCPYQTYDFVFSALANGPAIIDPSDYLATVPGLPYSTPSIVKIDADQAYTDNSAFGTPSNFNVHSTACAEAGSNPSAWPNPGALIFGYPDGTISEVADSFVLASAVAGNGVNVNYSSALPLDVPGATSQLVPGSYGPGGVSTTTADAAIKAAIYDWVRACGPRLITDVFTNTSLAPSVPVGTPCFIAIEPNSAGGAGVAVLNCEHTYGTSSNHQSDAISSSSLAAASTGQVYDLLIIDNVHNTSGSPDSGTHAGTPVYDVRLALNTQYSGTTTTLPTWNPTGQNPYLGWGTSHGGWGYAILHLDASLSQLTVPNSSTNGGGDTTADTWFQLNSSATNIRPTYPGGGLAVEISLHKAINSLQGTGPPPSAPSAGAAGGGGTPPPLAPPPPLPPGGG